MNIRGCYQRLAPTPLMNILSLDAISMTMFAHNITAAEGPNSVKTILHTMLSGPSDEDTLTNRIAMVAIGAFPKLLALPNPMKSWASKLKAELGRIAQEVWDVGTRNATVGGMDARVVEVLSMCLSIRPLIYLLTMFRPTEQSGRARDA